MAGRYEGEGFFALIGRHEVEKSGSGGFARVFAVFDPMDGDADDRPAH